MRIYLSLINGEWKEVDKSDFWIDPALLEKLKSLKKIQNKNWDGVIIIDGKERSGKSTLGMVIGWYISNGDMTEQNFASGLEDAAKKISMLPDKSVLVMDEGSIMFSSKDSTSSEQKRLVKLMDVVGQKNMVFIVCLPCFFDLNKTIAIRRSLFLCHVYPDKDYNRGRYAFFGEKRKKKLYLFGKKNFDSYAFPRAQFVNDYMKFEPHFYKKYLEEVKTKSLKEVMSDAMGEKVNADDKIRETESAFYAWLKKNKGMTYKELSAITGQPIGTIRDRIDAVNIAKETKRTSIRIVEEPKQGVLATC